MWDDYLWMRIYEKRVEDIFSLGRRHQKQINLIISRLFCHVLKRLQVQSREKKN